MNEPIDLLNLNTAELQELLAHWGEPPYRAVQLERWIYRELADDFDAMTNLPHPLRARLKESACSGALVPLVARASADGLTHKVLFKLADGETVETVLMRYADAPELAAGADTHTQFKRRTVCISTQVGCAIGCPFCATGQAGYVRNLTAGEIVAQALYFARDQKRAGFTEMPLTNIVVMGMGEPLLQFDVTWRAVQALGDPARFGLGARRITVSTAGVVPGIHRMAQTRSQVNLAVSLHTPDDSLRDVLVPLNRRYPLRDLRQACRDYVAATHRRITFEYALMDGINDRPEQARALARWLDGLLCHVNLIPLNPTAASPYKRTPYPRVKAFGGVLRAAGIATTLRVEKGSAIAAGCGQLRQTAQTTGPKSQVASHKSQIAI